MKKKLLPTMNQSKVLRSFFLSYSLILLLPIVLNFIFFLYSSQILRQEIQTADRLSLEQLCSLVDERFRAVDSLASTMALNEEVLSLMNASEDLTPYNQITLYQLMKHMKAYNTSNTLLQDFYVYFSNGGFAVNRYSKADLTYFGKFSLASYGIDASNLPSLLGGIHVREFVRPDEAKDKLVYLWSLPLYNPALNRAQFIGIIDMNALRQLLINSVWMDGGQLYLLDSENRVVVSSVEGDTFPDFSKMNLDSTAESIRIDGRDYVVTCIPSQASNMKFLSFAPADIYLGKSKTFSKYALSSIILCTLIGFTLIVYFSKKNYRPVSKLIRLFQEHGAPPLEKDMDELQSIALGIVHTIDENESLKSLNDRNHDYIKQSLLLNLLTGADSIKTSENKDLCGFDFPYSNFCVAVFYIEDFSCFYPEYRENDIEKTEGLIRFVIGNVAADILGSDAQVFEVETQNPVLLINASSDTWGDGVSKVERIFTMLKEQMGITVTISLSELVPDLSDIPHAYTQAVQNGKNRYFYSSRTVLYISKKQETEALRAVLNAPIPHQVRNMILARHFNEAKEQLWAYMGQFCEQRLLSLTAIQHVCKTVSELMLSVMRDYQKLYQINAAEFDSFENTLQMAEDIETVKEAVDSLFDKFSEQEDMKSGSLQDDLIQKACHYIEANYDNPDLSVNSVASYFDLSPSYLSRQFKATQKIGVLEFINKTKIRHAKELLASTNKSILAISELVGFLSTNTFIRTFKRLEGITPKAYKELMLAQRQHS